MTSVVEENYIQHYEIYQLPEHNRLNDIHIVKKVMIENQF